MQPGSQNLDLDVVVVGNVGVDTNVYSYGDEIDWTVEANFTRNIDCVGQAGGYASRGYARLGLRTAFVGSVGEDFCGRFVREELEREGIDLSGLFVDPAGTGRSVNFMYRDGRRKNFYDGKSHMTLRPDLSACRRVLSRARLAHFHIPNWARLLLPVARELGLIVACDLQDLTRLPDPYRQDFVDAADVLFFSAVNHADPAPLVRALCVGRSGRLVVAGMGARGCALGTGAQVRFFPPASLDIPVVDTNGAGDALAVGFLHAWAIQGLPPEEAIRRGQVAARFTCGIRASSAGLITAEQLESLSRG
ncbi:MAG TPA: carbohydrate kinase family protein [Anaeromyxobacter sp.]|nr:carbohydrate kinase family protein [Anaeromyxobacter sp.]